MYSTSSPCGFLAVAASSAQYPFRSSSQRRHTKKAGRPSSHATSTVSRCQLASAGTTPSAALGQAGGPALHSQHGHGLHSECAGHRCLHAGGGSCRPDPHRWASAVAATLAAAATPDSAVHRSRCRCCRRPQHPPAPSMSTLTFNCCSSPTVAASSWKTRLEPAAKQAPPPPPPALPPALPLSRSRRMGPVLPALPSSSRHTGRQVPAFEGSLLVRMTTCTTVKTSCQCAISAIV